ncbi:MAG TPA: hypothetical protein VHZ54_15230 [Solirubrobacterales bacterium]|jgi:hypothetical protein|nr:hypothetical protein [Solirubrobacterales bacterium]
MFSTHRRIALPLFAALMLGLLAIGVSACGSGNPREVEEGEVVKVGGLKYTVIFSRYLNENDNEDAAYLLGQQPLQEDSNFFGVFLQVQNTSHETKGLVKRLTITDAEDNVYDALPSESEFGFPFGGEVTENEQIPVLDSTAQMGAIQGSVAIFELPEEVSSNRPLLLHIPGPPGESGVVKIDL